MTDGLTRRSLLRGSLGGFLGFAAARGNDLFGQAATRSATGKSVIVLWMSGGPSQIDTWDPKPGRDNGGPTKAIDTVSAGIQYSENLRVCATQSEHIAVVRSMTSREGSHERGRYLLHTGYIPTGTVVHPSMGAIAAMELGKKDSELPNFISLGGSTEGAGFLPPEFNPFVVSGARGGMRGGGAATIKVDNVAYPAGVDKARFRERMKLLKEQEADFEKDRPSDELEKHKTAYEKADRLMHTPLLDAFDLTKEKAELVSAYGDSGFGRSCLVARRLVERGVPFIEVNLGGWDTHQDNFTRVAANCKQLDPGMGTLIRDLHEKRMLDRTLVVWMGEFGRTPKINPNTGRDHYPKAWSAAFAGGGVKGGRVIGSTDRDGAEVKDTPVTVPDLFATIYTLLGVDPRKKVTSPLGRPLAFSDNGTPVKDLIS